MLSLASSVQVLPGYQQARLACTRKQYRQAAQILARMAHSPEFSAEQQAYCRAQQQICLSHLSGAKVPTAPIAPAIPLPSDCGPRALLMICQKLGVQATLPALTKAAGTGPRGTSLAGLKAAAESLKLKTEALQVSREALPDVPAPAIAWVRGSHYIALLSLQGRGEEGTATIHDPNEARERTLSQEQLLQESSGYLLTIRR